MGLIKIDIDNLISKITPETASRHLMRDPLLGEKYCEYMKEDKVIHKGTLKSVLFKIGLICMLLSCSLLHGQVFIGKTFQWVMDNVNDDKFTDIISIDSASDEFIKNSGLKATDRVIVWYPNDMQVAFYFEKNICVYEIMTFNKSRKDEYIAWLNKLYYYREGYFWDGAAYGEVYDIGDKVFFVAWARAY